MRAYNDPMTRDGRPSSYLVPMVVESTNRGERAVDIYSRLLTNGILARHTGQPMECVQQDTDRDFFMTPDAAKAYGLIDDIILTPEKAGLATAGASSDGKEKKAG